MDCNELGNLFQQKAELNNLVSENTHQAFNTFKEVSKEIVAELNKNFPIINCRFENKGDFEFKLSFGSDTLVFILHTNIFEFPRLHEVMKLPYIKEDVKRSYCGMINIYNFLSDSFDYHRDLDFGYLIGRVFINKENHYFIEGKREVGLMYTSFHKAVIEKDSIYLNRVSSITSMASIGSTKFKVLKKGDLLENGIDTIIAFCNKIEYSNVKSKLFK